MKKYAVMLSAAVALFSVFAFASGETLQERIAPVGEVCMAGDECAAAVQAVSADSGPRSGEVVYKAACVNCHSGAIPTAPALGDAAAWSARLAKGIDVLYTNALNGLGGAMPPKGLCMDCSADELNAAVDYMIVNSK
ncbi:MAG: cytochrome c5 [Flavobacteriales bacterium]|jgi:cytochrome c5